MDSIDEKVMARLRAPFGCEHVGPVLKHNCGRWRIHDANDDAIASVSGLEEGYARLIVQALNEHFKMTSDLKELAQGIEECEGDGGCRATKFLRKLRQR